MKFVPMLAAAAAAPAFMAAAATASLAQVPAPVAPPEPPGEFAVCTACHETIASAGHSLGPNLSNVGGRKAGSLPDYEYSDAMKAADQTWDAATLQAFILDPAKSVPGNKMDYAGTGNADTAKAIADYLLTLKN